MYLLDADDHTWHSSGRSSSLYAGNLLVADAKDADDQRRLLFVAATRAKTYLELYRADGIMLRELKGDEGAPDAIESVEGAFDAGDLADAIQVDWRQSYAFDTPELRALLAEQLPPDHLSASSLNAFVKYDDGEPAAEDFPEAQVLGLPEAPKIFFEFGGIVHTYLQDYVERVLKAGDLTAAELAEKRMRDVERMDYRAEDVEQYKHRFERLTRAFGPWAEERLAGRVETEAALSAMTPDGVPLFGKCDLLLVDDDAKVVRVVDYKTGQTYPEGKPDPAYERQLQFYRLLVENSAEFAGYHVAACENWYVEPDKKTCEMREPFGISVSDADIEHLNALVNAVWNRLCRADFDMSAFETSDEKAEVLATKFRSNLARARALQRAYESWLINQ